MARKTEEVKIGADGGRDAGKVFLLTEMPASQAEAWATRFLLALARSGAEVPENALSLGMAGLVVVGLRALGGVSWDDAKPLMDEMMACVQIIPDPARPSIQRRLIEDDIEEIGTRIMLREKVIALHTGFSIAAGLSQSPLPSDPAATGTISNTPT